MRRSFCLIVGLLAAACGGMDIATEEYEAARKDAPTQWALVERLKTKVQWYQNQPGGAA